MAAGRSPRHLNWAEKFVDPTLFYSVTTVSLDGPGAEPSPELFAMLRRLPQLEALILSRSNAPGFESEIAGISDFKLLWLNLDRTRANDKTLRHLENMTSLTHLDLTRTRVSDRGLKHLERLTNLKTLKLMRCKVTEQGARALKAKLPGCKIHWEPFPRGLTLRL